MNLCISSNIFDYSRKAGGLLITGTEMTSQESEITSPEPEIMSPEPEVMSWFKMASGGGKPPRDRKCGETGLACAMAGVV